MKPLACSNCAYWFGIEATDNERGECRRNPPIIIPTPGQAQSVIGSHPQTDCDAWCGEFREWWHARNEEQREA